MWKLRVLAKWLLCRCTTVMEFCDLCGRDVEVVFRVEDKHWELIIGDPGAVRCLRCFDAAAQEKRVFLQWNHKPL